MTQVTALLKVTVFISILIAVCWLGMWLFLRVNLWTFRARPLLPPDARNIVVSFPRNTDDTHDRRTSFATYQAAEQVLEFYRKRLIRLGWTEVEEYNNCGNNLWQGQEVSGIFQKGEIQLKLWSSLVPTSTENVRIELEESTERSKKIVFPTNMLIGEWVSVDSLGDQAFLFCVNRSENAVLAYSEQLRIHGTQERQDTSLTITLEGEQIIRSEQDRQASEAFCSTIPPIFAEHCSLEIITRTGSISSGNAPIAIQRIEGSYQLAIEQNRFTITSPSGLSQSFIRTAIP